MPETLRVMSYNILLGGNGPNGDRTQLLAEIVDGARPDILALCECQGFLDDGGAPGDAFCQALGMRGAFVEAPSGQHVGILYREPWEPVDVLTLGLPLYHGLVRVTFQREGGRKLDVLATHLNPYSSMFRIAEAQVVLSRTRRDADTLIVGDLNSLPVGTALALNAPRLLDLQMQPDTEVARYFAAAGFIDVLAQHHVPTPTYPTDLDPKPDDFGGGVRLDYIMATRPLAKHCASAAVIDMPTAQQASDHLPVVAEFTLP